MTILKNGWVGVYELDFREEPSQTLGTDTTFTVGGKPWTKINSANDAVAMAIVNGSGLVIQPGSTSDYNGATRTLPGLALPLSQIVPGFQVGMGVRLWAYVSSYNGGSNYDNAVIAIDTQSSSHGHILKRGNGTTGVGFEGFININSSNQGFYGRTGLTIGSTNNVMVLESQRWGDPVQYFRYGAWEGSFPGANTLLSAKFGQIALAPDTTGVTSLNAAALLGAQRAGSGTSLSVTFERVRVEINVSG